MAVNETRSLSTEFDEGAVDGTVKRMYPNWAHRVMDATDRVNLMGGNGTLYDVAEAPATVKASVLYGHRH